MTQNRTSGRTALNFGKAAAAEVGKIIGAKQLTRRSNEFDHRGKRVCIKSTRIGNNKILITNRLAERMRGLIIALEGPQYRFNVHQVSMSAFRKRSEVSRSQRFRGKARVLSREGITDLPMLKRGVELQAARAVRSASKREFGLKE